MGRDLACFGPLTRNGLGGLCDPQDGIDLRFHAPRGEGGQPGLGSPSLDLIADFVAPLPNVRFCGRHDGVLNTPVDHENPP